MLYLYQGKKKTLCVNKGCYSLSYQLSVLSQSTMVVLQALSEYLINKPPPDDLILDVDVGIAGRKEIRYHFNPETAYTARSSRVRQTWQIVANWCQVQAVNWRETLGG